MKKRENWDEPRKVEPKVDLRNDLFIILPEVHKLLKQCSIRLAKGPKHSVLSL